MAAHPAILREEEIRPRALMEAKAERVDADRRFLLARAQRWVPVPCPACAADVPARYGDKNGFVYERCTRCGTVYTSPRPAADLLAEFYAQSRNYAFWNEHIFPATEPARRERIFRPRAERTREILARSGLEPDTFIAIGAAFGTYLEEIRRLRLARRIIAVEPTPGLARRCRDRGFETHESVVERIDLPGAADAVAAFEVIEHLFDPRGFVDRCARFLRPGGILLLSCPNYRGFGVAALGLRSGTFDHEHLNYFHPESLAAMVAGRGLEVLEVSTPGELDADLVKQAMDAGEMSFEGSPLLEEVFVRRWDELAGPFQRFLAENRLSSHMWLAARRPDRLAR